jgi:hypothetical protein
MISLELTTKVSIPEKRNPMFIVVVQSLPFGPPLLGGATTSRPPLLPMVAQTKTIPAVNGIKVNGKQNKSKNQLRREKAKQKKVQQPTVRPPQFLPHFSELNNWPYVQEQNGDVRVKSESEAEPERNVEYVSEQLDVKGPALEAFSDVFARFQLPPDASTVRVITTLHLFDNHHLKYHGMTVGPQERSHQGRNNLFRR